MAKAENRKSSLQRAGPYENPTTKVARVADGSGMAIDVSEGGQNYASTPFTAVAEAGGLAQRLFTENVPGVSSDFGGQDAGEGGKDEEASDVKQLLFEFRGLRVSMDSKFGGLQQQLADQAKQLVEQAKTFQEELAKLRADMVSSVQFGALEERVQKLEAGGLASSQISSMQSQLNRLDPANRCLAFTGFKDDSAESRVSKIQAFLTALGTCDNIVSAEHIWSGPPGQRKMTGVSVIEFPSRDLKEAVLKKTISETRDLFVKNNSGDKVSVGRAKTEWQRKRNGALRKAEDVLKKDSRAQGQAVVLEFDLEKDKSRSVKVGGKVAFRQTSGEMTGMFLAPFSNLSL